MNNAPFRIGLASVLALAAMAPAMAQDYRPTDQYQRDLDKYQADRAAYEARREAYDARRSDYAADRNDYRAARAAYDRRRADWERTRADYDARYGDGAYARYYGAAPTWDEAHDNASSSPPPVSASSDGRDGAYADRAGCRSDHSGAFGGGLIGALAGAALGSNVAARGHRGDGAVLGGVVGAGIGASVGNAHDKYKCDNAGPYYSYNETIPYRESRDYRSGRYDYRRYSDMRCRLVPAAIDNDGQDYRYVRVCPDGAGRYRITG